MRAFQLLCVSLVVVASVSGAGDAKGHCEVIPGMSAVECASYESYVPCEATSGCKWIEASETDASKTGAPAPAPKMEGGAGEMASCTAGKYKSSTGGCAECAAGQFSANVDASACVSCSAGRFQGEAGSATCVACTAGKFNDMVQQFSEAACKVCPPGTTSSASSDHCKTTGSTTDYYPEVRLQKASARVGVGYRAGATGGGGPWCAGGREFAAACGGGGTTGFATAYS